MMSPGMEVFCRSRMEERRRWVTWSRRKRASASLRGAWREERRMKRGREGAWECTDHCHKKVNRYNQPRDQTNIDCAIYWERMGAPRWVKSVAFPSARARAARTRSLNFPPLPHGHRGKDWKKTDTILSKTIDERHFALPRV